MSNQNSTNNTSNDGGGGSGGGGGGGGSDTIIAIVALVVSVIALIGTGLQVVQQYLASAAGYSNCDATVIGQWHVTKKRNFRLSEMRFQVLFETPVFFVCPATNRKGPVKDAEVWFVKGTDDSVQQTRSLPINDRDHKLKSAPSTVNGRTKNFIGSARPAPASVPMPAEKGVHTADNEMSTWVRLLQELQRMERDSHAWELAQYQHNPPGKACTFDDHTLCVALQAKKRSWDTMPASISRPYATTTISHLVEMAAMLGIYWKEFDRSAGRYRAEGNGYVLTGSHMSDLGIMFTFQICGQCRFQENRIIPADDCKELAFGLVPTIFRNKDDMRRLAFTTDDVHDLGTLLLGSRNELAETLVSFGCNTNTSNCLRDETKKHGHLFPLAFEIAGMLGRTLRIENSLFRLLPNPTFYRWDKKYFNMRKLLQGYDSRIRELSKHNEQTISLQQLSENINGLLRSKTQRDHEDKQENADGDIIDRPLLDALHGALEKCDGYLKQVNRHIVELVLREHIQELLRMVNNEGEYASVTQDEGTAEAGEAEQVGQANQAGKAENKTGNVGKAGSRLRFDDLMTASPEGRQRKLMQIYFRRLLPRVAEQASVALRQADDNENDNDNDAGARAGGGSSLPDMLEATSVWCTLVFRMLCWLLLHDFNKMDVQISKSELLGNRLPVYIW